MAYENAENQHAWRTVRPKIDPWSMYAQLKKLNGSPGSNSGKICCLETKTETVSSVHCQKPGDICMLWAGVQPTLDPYAEAFYSRPIALTEEGRTLVNDVCECVRD